MPYDLKTLSGIVQKIREHEHPFVTIDGPCACDDVRALGCDDGSFASARECWYLSCGGSVGLDEYAS